MKNYKKLVSALLLVVLFITMFPVTAKAANDGNLQLDVPVSVTVSDGNAQYLYFTPTQSALYVLTYSGTKPKEAYMILYDDASVELSWYSPNEEQHYASAYLKEGTTYTFGMFSYAEQKETFSVTLKFEQQQPIIANTSASVTLPNSNLRYFLFSPSETGLYSFAAVGTMQSLPLLCLFDDDNYLITTEYGYENTTNCFISLMLEKDNLYIVAVGTSPEPGTISLSVSFDQAIDLIPMQLDTPEQVQLINKPSAFYTFTAQQSGVYTIYSTGTTEDYPTVNMCYKYLFGIPEWLRGNNTGTAPHFSYDLFLEEGRTYIFEAYNSYGANDDFELTLTYVPNPPKPKLEIGFISKVLRVGSHTDVFAVYPGAHDNTLLPIGASFSKDDGVVSSYQVDYACWKVTGVSPGRVTANLYFADQVSGRICELTGDFKVVQIPQRILIMRLNSTKALLDGEEIYVDPTNKDVAPFTLNGKTMVPVRFIENLGADVKYNGVDKPVYATYDNIQLKLEFGNDYMDRIWTDTSWTGGIYLQTPPYLIESKTCVPIRDIAQGFEFFVSYDPRTYVIIVSTNAISEDELVDLREVGVKKLNTHIEGVKSITAAKTSYTVKAGDTIQLLKADITFKPSNVGCDKLLYSSDNEEVATVSSNGKIKAISKGTATITITSHNFKTTSITVTVSE